MVMCTSNESAGCPEKLDIRPFGTNDSIEELAGLLNRAYKELGDQGLRYSAVGQSAEETKRRINGGQCFIAVVDGRIGGTILYRSRAKGGRQPWYGHPDVAAFTQLAVEPAFQARGIAKALLDYVEGLAREEGAFEIAADTAVDAKRLLQMYERRGYRIVDYTYWPNTNYCSAIFSKRLHQDRTVRIGLVRRLRARWRARLRQMCWHFVRRGKSPFAVEES